MGGKGEMTDTLAAATQGRVGGSAVACFLEEGFDAHEFVAKARRSTPLDDLLADLQAHLLKLRESLVDTINQDYTAFVGMASNLKGLDESLCRVRLPVENLRTEVDELRVAAATAVAQVEGKLHERQAMLLESRRLNILLDAEKGLQRMEALLHRETAVAGAEVVSEAGQGESHPASDGEQRMRTAEVLERVANEAARLKGQVWRLDDDFGPVKPELLSRLKLLEDQLLQRANAIFTSAIALSEEEEHAIGTVHKEGKHLLAGRETLIQSCWRVYMVIDRLDECQSVMRQEAVRPFIAANVTVRALEDGVAGSCNGLSKLYQHMMWFVDQWCVPMCNICERAVMVDGTRDGAADADGAQPAHEADESEESAWERAAVKKRNFFLGNCFFVELAPALLSVGGRRVTQYLDSDFCKKYLLTMAFLRDLELRCRTRQEACALRQHASVSDFVQKWQVPLRAFSQLQLQEVSKALSAQLITPSALTAALEEHSAASAAAALGAHGEGRGPLPKSGSGTSTGEGGSEGVEAAGQGTSSAAAMATTLLPALTTGGKVEWQLQASAGTWQQVRGLWADVVPALAAKLLQLTALLLAKYHEWASEWARHLDQSLMTVAPQSGSAAATGGGSLRPKADIDKELRVVASLCNDCWCSVERIGSRSGGGTLVEADLVREVVDALVAGGRRDGRVLERSDIAPIVRECLGPCAQQLQEGGEALEQTVANVLVARAAEPLIAVRAITSKYRMTNTPAPTAPSLYVRGVTQPLRTALAEGGEGGHGFLAAVGAPSRARVLALIVTAVAGKYSDLVVELFGNVKRLGQTLKKLQKGSTAVGEGGLGDDEKIFLQVYLDVESMAHELELIGAQVKDNAALMALREKVTSTCHEYSVALPDAVPSSI